MRILTLLSVVALIFACSMMGCKSEEQVGAADTQNNDPIDRSPEDRLNEIIERLKQAVETDEPGVVTGFTVLQDGGRSRLSFQTSVTHELFPPEKPTDNYRAVISVTTRSRYTVKLPGTEEVTGKSSNKDTRDDSEADEDDPSSINGEFGEDLSENIFGPEEPSKNGSRTPSQDPLTEEILSTPANENVQTFELEYQGDHWVLKTKPQQESIEDALNRALQLQY